MPNWVTLKKYCEETGESPNAVRKRRQKGEWLDGREIQCKNRRLWVNVPAAQAWLQRI